MKIAEGMPLSRLTTIGTGGPARAFAKPTTLAELEQALAWAATCRPQEKSWAAREASTRALNVLGIGW